MSTQLGQEIYAIRRQVFRLFGAGFDIYNQDNAKVGYCHQKAFKLREDLRIFTDRTKSQELLRMKARQIIDFSATYDVTLPTGEPLGSLRRKGLASLVVRDSWEALDAEGKVIGRLQEDSTMAALARRFLPLVAILVPERFHLRKLDASGKIDESSLPIATLRTHFNPFIYRLSIARFVEDEHLDDLMLLAIGCLIAAVEGRQTDQG